MFALLSIAALITKVTAQPAIGILPNFSGYLKFQTSFSGGSWYNLPAPDPSGHGDPYTPTHCITDVNILTTICDAYPDGCQWHNGGAGYCAIGTLKFNSTANTYVKEAIGTFVNGTKASSKYFVLDETRSSNQFCVPYVGWELPVDIVKSHCDQDTKCDAFIMKVDNSYGQLCSFSSAGVCDPCRLHLKLA